MSDHNPYTCTNDSIRAALSHEVDPAFALRAAYIFREVEKNQPKHILEVGCGRGFYIQGLMCYPFIRRIHGIDVKDSYLIQARATSFKDPRVKLRNASAYSLPYNDNSMDMVICTEVLEHLKQESHALNEIHRVLKPSGILVVSVPSINFPLLWDPLNWLLMRLFNTHINKNIWWLAGIWADHERLYTKSRLREILSKSLFDIQDMRGVLAWCWPFTHFVLYGIGKNIIEVFGTNIFSRFVQSEQSLLVRLIASIMRLPSVLLDGKGENSVHTNILVACSKN